MPLQATEMMNSAIVALALKMKVIVILMMSVKMVLLVDQIIVQLHLVLTLKLIVVIHALVLVEILAGKEITIVMMKTTIVDVNGMEETVVVPMLTQLFVQLVNV